MWKALARPAMIFVPLALGFFFPEAGEYKFLIRYLLMLMLFMVFLKLEFRELKLRRSHFLLLAVNLLIGAGAFLLTGALTRNDTLAQAAFFTGITPTAAAAAVVMEFLGGSSGYVVTSFVVTNAGMALFLPVLLGWVCGNSSPEFILRAAEGLFYLLAVPALGALAVRGIFPGAKKWPARLATANFSLWSLCLFIIAASAGEFFRRTPHISPWIVAGAAGLSLFLCILNFSLGTLLGEKGLRHESSQSLGQKNTTLTICLALDYAGPLAAMGVISYVFWHNSYNAIQLFLMDRNRGRRPEENRSTTGKSL